MPPFPSHDGNGDVVDVNTAQWIIHHRNLENWNDHIWNIMLCLRSEHATIEKADYESQYLLNAQSYRRLV